MPLPPLADVAALEARAGGVAVEDPAQAEALLAHASAIVRAYVGRTWVDDDGNLDGVPDGVPGVVVEMVYRVMLNPEGVTQDTAGPFSLSFGPNAAERLYLSNADRIILNACRPRAFSVDPTPSTSPLHPLRGALVNGPAGWAPGEA